MKNVQSAVSSLAAEICRSGPGRSLRRGLDVGGRDLPRWTAAFVMVSTPATKDRLFVRPFRGLDAGDGDAPRCPAALASVSTSAAEISPAVACRLRLWLDAGSHIGGHGCANLEKSLHRFAQFAHDKLFSKYAQFWHPS